MKNYVRRVYYQILYVIVSFIVMYFFYYWNFFFLPAIYNDKIAEIYRFNGGVTRSSSESCSGVSDNSMSFNNYAFRLNCKENSFSDASLVKSISLPILGAIVGQLLGLIYKTMFSFAKRFYSDQYSHEYEGTKHIYVYFLMIFISCIQLTTTVITFYDHYKYTCVDFLQVENFPYIWAEWLCVVPLMFFLTSVVDIDSSITKPAHVWIEFFGGISIFLLFLVNFPSLPHPICLMMFILSNILMAIALYWQFIDSYTSYLQAYQNVVKIPVLQKYDVTHKLTVDEFKIYECKLNCSIYMSITFTIFPILYYFRRGQWISLDFYLLVLLLLNFICKTLFIHVVSNIHFDIFDPVKSALIEERKRAEESRIMFLRYVFHEIRVPLNSISLGLQVLNVTSRLDLSEKDVINTMLDGEGLHVYTCIH